MQLMRRHRRAGGFTLIEMIMVIIVIGILAAVALQSLSVSIEDVRRRQTEEELDLLAAAIVGHPGHKSAGTRSDFGYVGDVGAFPPDLDALATNPGGFATWDGPYLAPGFDQDSTGYLFDAWGQPYGYSGGITLTSSGNGTAITKKITAAASDYLLNSFTGRIYDALGQPPGAEYVDSIMVAVTFPDGAGALQTKSYGINQLGGFALDSLPAGTHRLAVIYTPVSDTIIRYITVLPRNKGSIVCQFATDYFSATFSGPGSPVSGSETLRPIAPGSSTGLTGSGCGLDWQCVAEEDSDDDVTYVRGSGNSYLMDAYALEDPSAGSGAIDSIVISIRCRGTGGGQWIRTLLVVGGSAEYYGSSANLATTSHYEVFTTTYTANPATSSAWTWPEINSLQAGASIRREARCTQVWVDVFYTE